MKSWHRYVVCAGLLVAAATMSTQATAQKVHRYGGIGSDEAGSTSVNTQPAPVQAAMGQQTTTADDADEDAQEDTETPSADTGDQEAADELEPSHRIQLHGSPAGVNTTPRTTLDLAVDQLYRGIIPGKRDEVEHLSKAQKSGADAAHANELTWLGFTPTDEYTRVFLQTARKAQYNIRRKQDPALIEIMLENTEIPAKNFTRDIDTRYFGRNVTRVEAKKTGRSSVKVTIELKKFEQPTVRESGNYLYLDFAPGAENTTASDAHAAGQ